MKIYINGKFLTQRITGVQRYAWELIKELDTIVKKDEVTILIPPNVSNDFYFENIETKKIGRLKGNMWEQISLLLYAKKSKIRLLNLCNSAPILYPDIVTIHDVKIKARPEYFSRKFLIWYNFMFKKIIKRAKEIITVSEFSKSEIVKYYNVDSKKIHVIYNAWQHYERIEYDEESLNKYKLKKDNYYFAMSSLEPNKNFKWIAEVAKKNPKYTFAVAGSINEKVFSDGLGFKCPNNMKLLGYVTDKEAKTLMRDCKAFLFPSFYEGFGIPPLEALSAGANNLVVSDIPVMHEIFENNVNYINPSVNNMVFQEKYFNRKEILSKFSWKKSAEKLKKITKVENNNDIL